MPDDEDPFAEDANLAAFKEMVAGLPSITGDLIEGAKGLDPPSEVEDAHDHMVDRGEALVIAFEDGAERLGTTHPRRRQLHRRVARLRCGPGSAIEAVVALLTIGTPEQPRGWVVPTRSLATELDEREVLDAIILPLVRHEAVWQALRKPRPFRDNPRYPGDSSKAHRRRPELGIRVFEPPSRHARICR